MVPVDIPGRRQSVHPGALRACLSLHLGFVYLPPLQAVFGSAALDASEWSKVVLAARVRHEPSDFWAPERMRSFRINDLSFAGWNCL